MSVADGRCNYCGKPATRVLLWDCLVCSDKCDTALSWLLDGVPITEVEAKFGKGAYGYPENQK